MNTTARIASSNGTSASRPATATTQEGRPALKPHPASGIGAIAHAVVASLAGDADKFGRAALTERCLVTSASWARGSSATARSNAVIAAGFANRYLQTLLPAGETWELLGCEVGVDAGRVDLAFRNRVDGAIVFDEIKCAYVPRATVDQKWVTQCRRYAAAGVRRFDDAFVGVRLLPLGSIHVASLVPAAGRVVALQPTRLNLLARRGAA